MTVEEAWRLLLLAKRPVNPSELIMEIGSSGTVDAWSLDTLEGPPPQVVDSQCRARRTPTPTRISVSANRESHRALTVSPSPSRLDATDKDCVPGILVSTMPPEAGP